MLLRWGSTGKPYPDCLERSPLLPVFIESTLIHLSDKTRVCLLDKPEGLLLWRVQRFTTAERLMQMVFFRLPTGSKGRIPSFDLILKIP
ncbi:MAG: hypothetical protein E3K32_03630 [wastewater metagenome]|nr:hypothetical protein [Candidatus Loosdrechtia aerotolerans]